MGRLGGDPAAGRHDHPVGGGQPGADRGGQRDEREHSRVEQQEVLHRNSDHVAGPGHGTGGQRHGKGDRTRGDEGPVTGPVTLVTPTAS